MRFRTAAILSVVLVGGMFAPRSQAEPWLAGTWDGREWKFQSTKECFSASRRSAPVSGVLLAIPIVSVLFTIATFTNQARQRR